MDTASFVVEDGEGGKRLVLQAEWDTDIKKLMQSEGIKELWINYARGFPGRDVSFVADLTFLESLDIIVYGVKNLESVEALTHLKSFYNGCRDKTRINFDLMPHLERCGLDWHPGISSLLDRQSLRWINIGHYPAADLTGLAKLRQLKCLSLVGGRLTTLEGLAFLPHLQELGLGYLKSLASLDGLQTASELRRLEIYACFDIHSVAEVAGLSHLRWLDVSHCREIDTLSPVENLRHLAHVSFTESTNVVDGDLRPLLHLPSLKEAFFRDRKHYTHRRNVFPPWNEISA